MMINEVAPIPWSVVIFVIYDAPDGIKATTPKHNAPSKVILESILSRASAVGLPGFIPGIDEPYFFKLFAISFGCILGIIEA